MHMSILAELKLELKVKVIFVSRRFDGEYQ